MSIGTLHIVCVEKYELLLILNESIPVGLNLESYRIICATSSGIMAAISVRSLVSIFSRHISYLPGVYSGVPFSSLLCRTPHGDGGAHDGCTISSRCCALGGPLAPIHDYSTVPIRETGSRSHAIISYSSGLCRCA